MRHDEKPPDAVVHLVFLVGQVEAETGSPASRLADLADLGDHLVVEHAGLHPAEIAQLAGRASKHAAPCAAPRDEQARRHSATPALGADAAPAGLVGAGFVPALIAHAGEQIDLGIARRPVLSAAVGALRPRLSN